MRAPSDSRISRREMPRRATALYSFTGTLSSPKLIEPLQIALAIADHLPDCSSRSRAAANGLPVREPSCDHAAVLFELRDVSLARGGRRVDRKGVVEGRGV